MDRLRTELSKSEEFGLEFETGKGRVPVICRVWKLTSLSVRDGITYVLRLVLDEDPEGGTAIQASLGPSTGSLVTIHLLGGAYVFLLPAVIIVQLISWLRPRPGEGGWQGLFLFALTGAALYALFHVSEVLSRPSYARLEAFVFETFRATVREQAREQL